MFHYEQNFLILPFGQVRIYFVTGTEPNTDYDENKKAEVHGIQIAVFSVSWDNLFAYLFISIFPSLLCFPINFC